MAIPLFNAGMSYPQLAIQTEDPFTRGAVRGAAIAERIPGMAASIASGFTKGVKDYSDLEDAASRREYNDAITRERELQLERDQAEQTQAIELKRKQNEEALAKLNEEARIREKEQKFYSTLQNGTDAEKKAAVLSGQYGDILQKKETLEYATKVVKPLLNEDEQDTWVNDQYDKMLKGYRARNLAALENEADKTIAIADADPYMQQVITNGGGSVRNTFDVLDQLSTGDLEVVPQGTYVMEDGEIKTEDGVPVKAEVAPGDNKGLFQLYSKKQQRIIGDNVPKESIKAWQLAGANRSRINEVGAGSGEDNVVRYMRPPANQRPSAQQQQSLGSRVGAMPTTQQQAPMSLPQLNKQLAKVEISPEALAAGGVSVRGKIAQAAKLNVYAKLPDGKVVHDESIDSMLSSIISYRQQEKQAAPGSVELIMVRKESAAIRNALLRHSLGKDFAALPNKAYIATQAREHNMQVQRLKQQAAESAAINGTSTVADPFYLQEYDPANASDLYSFYVQNNYDSANSRLEAAFGILDSQAAKQTKQKAAQRNVPAQISAIANGAL